MIRNKDNIQKCGCCLGLDVGVFGGWVRNCILDEYIGRENEPVGQQVTHWPTSQPIGQEPLSVGQQVDPPYVYLAITVLHCMVIF